MAENHETYERYANRHEAENTYKEQKLLPRPDHESQPKWIAETGALNPKTLGKRKNYSYRIKITVKKETKKWLKQFEAKPHNEPGRYAVPAQFLSEFNDKYIISISIEKRS